MAPSVPAAAKKVAKRIRRLPGVVGVFWGHGKTKGRRRTDESLVVHVRWKHDPSSKEHAIPPVIDGQAVDVEEVGGYTTHALTHTDDLVADGGLVRHGTLTAIVVNGTDVLALMSGHVGLPLRNGAILHQWSATVTDSMAVVARETGGADYKGAVLRGRLGDGGPLDYAFGRFPGVPTSNVNPKHAAAGMPPFPVRNFALLPGEQVMHWSRLPGRNKLIYGRYAHTAVSDVNADLPDGNSTTYSGVLAIDPIDTLPFSEEGDSGSLVVDTANPPRVVGVVLGAANNGSYAAVLPINALSKRLGGQRSLFFS